MQEESKSHIPPATVPSDMNIEISLNLQYRNDQNNITNAVEINKNLGNHN